MLKNLYSLAALVLCFSVLSTTTALAQTEDAFCIAGLGDKAGIISTVVGIVVVIASTLANTVSKQSFIGKLIHFLAINLTVDKVTTKKK